MAATTWSRLITRRIWPISISREAICALTTQILRERGVAEADIEQAWTVEGGGDDAPRFSTAIAACALRSPQPQHAR
jgi:hypothetical protein